MLTRHTEAEKAGVASALTSKATRARQAVFHTHPERLGYDVGEAVGSAVGNLLIAVFTEGVGNAVTKVAGETGRVCPVLARGERRRSPRSARPSRPWRTRSAPSSKGRSAR
ncbi:hypothetical protein [Streptomyces sp. MJM1172]|uniref:hypothetical protein n=1 Tax=Streptomyces sp. MJM1172 TaxID=1703926 RepID=UPI00093CFFD9|nr:hypothetical protein [Streptomyces sp. MJM1172]OKI50835.1 hypothetical protein AMK15_31815 [Streptomyces sp. MJM1172]